MISSSKTNVQQCVALSVKLGLTHVVCSPGSRNAPLIIAFNQHPSITCVVIPDERSAAFFAMGLAQQLSSFVAVCCTSGSALLNYYPAIAEAFYQKIPLLILSADRPNEWVDQGDGQTIRQTGVFVNHILYSTTIPESEFLTDGEWFIKRELSKCFYYAKKGPVHLNFPFSEPLYDTIELSENAQFLPIKVEEPTFSLSIEQVARLRKKIKASSKIMVLCGQLSPSKELTALLTDFAKNTGAVVLAENTSNCISAHFINCIDRSLESIEGANSILYEPDLVLVIGDAVVSKKIKTFLRSIKTIEAWRIGENDLFMDTYKSVLYSYAIDPITFFSSIHDVCNVSDRLFQTNWNALDASSVQKANCFLNQAHSFSDLVAFNQILTQLPENQNLHLANSSVIRYSQLFDPINKTAYYCNRGTSGVDGSSSTAYGAAFGSPSVLNTLITGDISFFYDSNAFWNTINVPNLKVILINNGGGGIFKIIPGPSTTKELDDFFVYSNSFTAEKICATFGLPYLKANSIDSLKEGLEILFSDDNKSTLLEVFTPSDINDVVLSAYFKFLKNNN